MKGFIQDIIRGRALGHPIHIVMAHFPAALFPFALAIELLHYFSPNSTYIEVSRYSLIGGLIMGGLAIIFGFMDLINIPENTKAFKTAVKHAIINSVVLTIFFTLLAARKEFAESPSWIYVSLVAFGNLLMFFGNYLGGELILKHGVGTRFFKDTHSE